MAYTEEPQWTAWKAYLATLSTITSGVYVQISGQGIRLQSGENVVVQSGIWTMGIALADVSGEWLEVHVMSGDGIILVSGAGVVINSGAPVTIQSGSHVIINSGTPVTLESGSNVIINSGAPVTLESGSNVIINSGAYVQISGQGVQISGQTVNICTPQSVFMAVTLLGNISGGVAFASGDVVSVTIKNPGFQTGDVYLGGAGHAYEGSPYSGHGLQLSAGEAQTFDIANPNAIHGYALISGDIVQIIGVSK